MHIDVDDKVAIVTGGSRGIGYAIAREILAAGGRACITGRRQDSLERAARELGDADHVMAVAGSTDNAEHRASAVAQVVERFGHVDLLVNNAATNAQFGPLIEANLAAVAKTMSANVVAVVGWCQECWNRSMSERGGAIVNISSVGGLRPGKYTGAYNLSKAALIHLTRQLGLELGPKVRVNALAVGLVPTQMSSVLFENNPDAVLAQEPLGRFGTVEDIASAALFLLSSAASWITGETVVVDGGGSSLSGVTETVVAQLKFSTAEG
jgi:3-oxoacyl-[acyl-carrier protein] reductase